MSSPDFRHSCHIITCSLYVRTLWLILSHIKMRSWDDIKSFHRIIRYTYPKAVKAGAAAAGAAVEVRVQAQVMVMEVCPLSLVPEARVEEVEVAEGGVGEEKEVVEEEGEVRVDEGVEEEGEGEARVKVQEGIRMLLGLGDMIRKCRGWEPSRAEVATRIV